MRRLELLADVGSGLADSAQAAGMSAPVPTCPDWTVRDLLAHIGMVHRWAATIVGERRDGPDVATEPEPGSDVLVQWYRDGHIALVETLTSAASDGACWFFLPSPSPLQFWIRRQLHETAIHRVDAGFANGEVIGYDADLGADGLDELITGFLPRPVSDLHLAGPTSLAVQAEDVDRVWRVVIGPGVPVGVEITGEPSGAPADCIVRGRASDLYLLLWNRRDRSGLEVEGDDGVLDAWRTQLRVRWR